eukprot:XP_001694981.1 predicted protein [Chlamydomonas reinhardtii]
MPRMGWKLSGSETLKVPLAKLSVRMATSMQLDDVATRRADLHEDYERAAQGLPPRAVVRQAQLWLVQAPPGFQQRVWDVVVMAALAATEHGRVRLRGMTRATAALGIQTAAAAAPEAAVAGVNPVELACARAVADFWSRLMQFAQLGVPQKGWDGVDATHPSWWW